MAVMRKKTMISVAQTLQKPGGQLKQLSEQLSRLQKLNADVLELLEPDLRPHCHVANWRDNTLVLCVTSGLIATRMRYQVPELLSRLRSAGHYSLANIRIMIQPESD